MLYADKSKVQKIFAGQTEVQKSTPCGTILHHEAAGKAELLYTLFGSKCLPDETKDDTKDEAIEPNPAEPEFKRGDIVLFRGSKCRITDRFSESCYYLTYAEGKYRGQFLGLHKESDLEPYTEPRNKDSGFIRAESVKEARIADEETYLRNLSQETSNCDKHFDNILKDSFRDHNRLHIAAMLCAGMLANDCNFYPIDRAIELADKLIAECKKGGNNA